MATQKQKTSARNKYNPKLSVTRLEQLLQGRNETWREASLDDGLVFDAGSLESEEQ